MPKIQITWTVIPFSSYDSPKSIINSWENEAKKSSEHLIRTTYVIRIANKFAINYQHGISPVLYIGEGDFEQRISQHLRTWIKQISELLNNPEFEVAIALPRVQNNKEVYRDFEAYLIKDFSTRYGVTPYYNQQNENTRFEYSYEGNPDPTSILHDRDNHIWAINPLRDNNSYYTYNKGY